MAVFKVAAERAKLDAANAERDARLLPGRLAWLAERVAAYDGIGAISDTEAVTFAAFLAWVDIP